MTLSACVMKKKGEKEEGTEKRASLLIFPRGGGRKKKKGKKRGERVVITPWYCKGKRKGRGKEKTLSTSGRRRED